MSHSASRLLVFGPYTFDPDQGLLFRGGETVPLPPKAMQTLTVLATSGGRLLSKDELMRAIWPDTFVEEQNLTLNIYLIRKALNAAGSGEAYIETIPKRGYRFIAPVQETAPTPPAPAPAPPTPQPATSLEPQAVRPPARARWRIAVPVIGVLSVALAGIEGARLAERRPAVDVDAGPALVRLTANIADDHQPDVSPDGRHIAFVSNRDGGKGEIYVMDADGRNPRNLTQNPANDDTPAWSPDGRQIAFQTDRRGVVELFLINADGSNPHPVAPGARAAWSPDGRRLAYQRAIDGRSQIFTIDLDGGQAHQLTNDTFAGDPTWSPDGQSIAFTTSIENVLQIAVMRADGSGRRLLTQAGDNSLPAWGADGRILFNSDRDGSDAVWIMQADGLLQHRIEAGAEAGWWPGGHAIVFQSDRDGNSELYRLRIGHDPDGAVRLTDNVADDDVPSWSPDGRSIAFESNRDGKPHIFVMDADGAHPRNLTPGSASDRAPSWSPDGRSIAFASDRDGGTAIYVMAAEGGRVRRLTTGPHDAAPHWSPDGRSLCYVADGGIWRIAGNGGDGERLVSGESCTWSPSASQIVFGAAEGSLREIFAIPAGGGARTPLTKNGHANGGPAWDPRGGLIAFNSNQDGFGLGVFVMRPDGTGQTRLAGLRSFDANPAWSPDGRWIAFSSARDGNREIYKIAVR